MFQYGFSRALEAERLVFRWRKRLQALERSQVPEEEKRGGGWLKHSRARRTM